MRRIDLRKVQAARSNTIRDINRQIVLNYVREREPISRAEIARATDLQRSTVSAIVEVLHAEGLVEEIGEGESTGGRRPTLLKLRASEAVAVGVAVTPTVTIVAASTLAGRIVAREQFPTDPDWQQTQARIVASINKLRDAHPTLEAIGVSVPGLVDPENGQVLNVPFFKWHDLLVEKELAAATGLEVTVDNDANAAALAELWFGRSEISQVRDFLMILVGEGIGTGMIFDGQIYRGQHGAAGEFGHMIIGTGAPTACSCGNYDCWEAFASERAALARYNTLRKTSPGVAINNFNALLDEALRDTGPAREALLQTVQFIGVGVSNLVVGFSPRAVVISGSIVRAWPLIAQILQDSVQRSVRRGLAAAPLIASTLGEIPSLMGALSLVLASKFAAHTLAE